MAPCGSPWHVNLRSPESGHRLTWDARSSRLVKAKVMSPHQLGEVTALAEISRTPPGLMSGPAWRVGTSYVISEAPEKGPEVPSLSDISEILEAPQVWLLGKM